MLSKFTKARKIVKLTPELHGALTPDDAVVVDAPANYAQSAIEAALSGEFEPAADVLAWTRQNAMWDDRSRLVSKFSSLSMRSPGWLESWRAATPENPDLATVAASVLIHQAWEQRSDAQATEVSSEQFEAFHTTLESATMQLQAAVDLSPGDPEPWSQGPDPRARDRGAA